MFDGPNLDAVADKWFVKDTISNFFEVGRIFILFRENIGDIVGTTDMMYVDVTFFDFLADAIVSELNVSNASSRFILRPLDASHIVVINGDWIFDEGFV